MGAAGSGGGLAWVRDRRVPVSKRGEGGGLEASGLGQSTVAQAWNRGGGPEGSRGVLGRLTNVVLSDMAHMAPPKSSALPRVGRWHDEALR